MNRGRLGHWKRLDTECLHTHSPPTNTSCLFLVFLPNTVLSVRIGFTYIQSHITTPTNFIKTQWMTLRYATVHILSSVPIRYVLITVSTFLSRQATSNHINIVLWHQKHNFLHTTDNVTVIWQANSIQLAQESKIYC